MVSDEQILEWARKKYPRPYSENLELMRRAYRREHGSEIVSVADLRDGMDRVTIEVLLVEVRREYSYEGCRSCFAKRCKCGKEDYGEINRKVFVGGDATGLIEIDFAPFIDTEKLSVDKCYQLEGRVKSFNKNLTFNASRVIPKEDAKLIDATRLFIDFVQLNRGMVQMAKVEEFAKSEGFYEILDEVIKKSGAEVIEGLEGKEVVLR